MKSLLYRIIPAGRTARDVLRVLSGSLATTALNFFVSIGIARLVSVDAYGLFGTANVMLTLVPMVVDAGLSVSLVRFLGDGRHDRRQLLSTILTVKLLTGAVMVLAALLLREPLAVALFGSDDHALLLVIVAVGCAIANVAMALQAYSQAGRDFVGFTLQTLLPTLVKCIAVLVLVITSTVSLLSVVAVTSLATVTGLVYGIWRHRRDLTPQPSPAVLGQLLAFGKWIALTGILSALLMRTDMFMLTVYGDSRQVGFYYAAFQLAFAFPLVTMSVTNVLLPMATGIRGAEERRRYVHRVLRFTPVVAALAAAVVLLAPVVVPLLFGQRYVAAAAPFAILASVFILGMIVTPLGLVILSINRPELQTFTFLVQLAVNVVVDYLLIPQQGATGAAWGTFAAKVAGALLTFLLVRRYVFGREGCRQRHDGAADEQARIGVAK
uniref:Undecaprenyl-diphospho-oligosaccharide flippase n=1 Tax=Geobacter metallireducens TaxID=28232 RepID=A0A831UER1_GEOME